MTSLTLQIDRTVLRPGGVNHTLIAMTLMYSEYRRNDNVAGVPLVLISPYTPYMLAILRVLQHV